MQPQPSWTERPRPTQNPSGSRWPASTRHQPDPRCAPHAWRYAQIRPGLLEAGDLAPGSRAERRVLMLANPSRDPPFTADTLYEGLQLVMAGDTARARTGTRRLLCGSSRITMRRGDVIVTPRWNWHDHGKDGSGPMVWLDGLDLPCFQHLPVHFVGHFAAPRYPAEDVDSASSPLVFPWSGMKTRLDGAPGDWAELRYLKGDGSEVSKTLGGAAARINAGRASPIVQETASSVYHVVEGSGYTTIGGRVFNWEKGDTFCIPSWYPYQHFASGSSDGAPA
ncbi:hypothetical protein INS49_004193 [Diaporthe citri]|uniref:uncharacterized protein n=1 Tax=Diaporthe citri TaxID=83186 RepID=UPI001C800FB4|nr:uncharacterized protein INS49_004193 [Diaporthe citri]KAG6355112.1 hypothetical protein INS49_004193 [Diaporthe citri]